MARSENSRPTTVSEYFDRGLRRRRHPGSPVSGESCTDKNGLTLRFELDVQDGLIRQARYECSTCITLVAYSELLAERVQRMELREAIRLQATDLIRALQEVPPAKQDRAVLAIRALQFAIKQATHEGGPR